MAAPSDFLSREFTRPVAERELVLVTPAVKRRILVRLGEPVRDVPTVQGLDWRCPVQLEGADQPTPPPGIGVDSLQALLAGIQMAHTYLALLERQSGGVLHWFDEPGHSIPDLGPAV